MSELVRYKPFLWLGLSLLIAALTLVVAFVISWMFRTISPEICNITAILCLPIIVVMIISGLQKNSKVIVDTRNATREMKEGRGKIFRL